MKRHKPIMGHHAPAPRPTPAAALLLALTLSAPFAALAGLELVIRAFF